MDDNPASARRQEGRQADVERTRIRGYTLASVAVHVVVVLSLSLLFSPPQKPVFAKPIYSVALVEWPEPNYEPPKPARRAPEPPKERVEPPKPEPKPEPPDAVPLKPRPRPEMKEPEPKPKPKPKEPPKKEPEPPKEDPAPEPTPEVEAPPAEDPEPVSLGTVDQKDFKHNYYLERVRALLARAWARPRLGSGTLRSTVHFVVKRDGTVVASYVSEPSGVALYDRSAMSAVLSVGKLPPLPQGYDGEELGLSVVFQSLEGQP